MKHFISEFQSFELLSVALQGHNQLQKEQVKYNKYILFIHQFLFIHTRVLYQM